MCCGPVAKAEDLLQAALLNGAQRGSRHGTARHNAVETPCASFGFVSSPEIEFSFCLIRD